MLIAGLKTLELARRAGHKTLQVIRLDTRALLICERNLLKHPAGWLDYELRAIASYLQAYAQQHYINYKEPSQDLGRSICQHLGLKDNVISNARAFSFFKPKSRPNKTINDDNPSKDSNKLKI